MLADGSVYPRKGRITFANADYNTQTGTFLLRATLPNPEGALRPGQFVRVRVLGAVRVNAILVPQQAVLQGAKGHFVMVVDKEGKAQIRGVQVGQWYGDDWFITEGLQAGDVVVTDGVARLSPGAPVKVADASAKPPGSADKPAAPAPAPQEVARRPPDALPLLHRPADLLGGHRAGHLGGRASSRWSSCRSRNTRR